MDIAAIIGMIASFGLVVWAIGAGAGNFVDGASLAIVVGTLGATLVAYPLLDVMKLVGILKNTILMTSAGFAIFILRNG